MALDEILLESVAANVSPPTLRLYQWNRPAITIGRFQDVVRTLKNDFCQQAGIPLVRRITGGRGILHGDDLTVSLAASLEHLGLQEPVRIVSIYERIATGLVQALQSQGVMSVLGTGLRQNSKESSGDCFASLSQADIAEEGTGIKLLGAALHCRDRALLMQASIRLWKPENEAEQGRIAAGAFRGKTAEKPRTLPVTGLNACCLSEQIGAQLLTALRGTADRFEAESSELEAVSRLMEERLHKSVL